MPTGLTGRIVIREPHQELATHGVVAIDSLFDRIETTLTTVDIKIWILLDRLDVAFVEDHALEANALRALLRVYGDFRKYENISLKIFLREDIWKRIMQPG